MFALADCNNFFVSCERVFRPDLATRPVVVLSNNDGCAISRSNEAKRLGVKMGQPYFEWATLAQREHIAVFSSNFRLYGDMSHRVQQVLREAAPAIEVYSIDECFMDLRGMEPLTDLDQWAKALSAKCLKYTAIPISVGVAPTKTLAKVASKLCKQYPKLQGGCYMHRTCDVEKVLQRFPLEDIWGIGRRYYKRFSTQYGMTTALDFYKKDPEWIRRQMGIVGLRLWNELHGVPCLALEAQPAPKKQIMVSRSFAKEITTLDALCEQVSLFCAMALEKLRKQHSLCQSATVFLQTNRHREGTLQQHEGRLLTFPTPLDSTIEVNRAVLAALRALFRPGYAYKRAGLLLSDLTSATVRQTHLFDPIDHAKHARLMQCMDQINQDPHLPTLHLASQSPTLHMQRAHLSPQYTTCWDEIPIAHV